MVEIKEQTQQKIKVEKYPDFVTDVVDKIIFDSLMLEDLTYCQLKSKVMESLLTELSKDKETLREKLERFQRNGSVITKKKDAQINVLSMKK